MKILECFGKKPLFETAWEIRREVFIDEQSVPESVEQDAWDDKSWHLVLFQDEEPIATGRVVKGESGLFHIGRVAVVKEKRGHGYGDLIMMALLDLAWRESAESVEIHAQCHALKFYERLGFQAYGDTFDEAGIEHISMRIARQ